MGSISCTRSAESLACGFVFSRADGVRAIDASWAAVTVRVVVLVIEPDVALIVTVPVPVADAKPPAAIVAVPVPSFLLHVTEPVRSAVVASV